MSLPYLHVSQFGEASIGEVNGHLMLIVLVAGSKRVLSLERVMRGKFKGNLLYRMVPLVEALSPPASTTRALVPTILSTAAHKGSDAQADSGQMGVSVDDVYRDYPST